MLWEKTYCYTILLLFSTNCFQCLAMNDTEDLRRQVITRNALKLLREKTDMFIETGFSSLTENEQCFLLKNISARMLQGISISSIEKNLFYNLWQHTTKKVSDSILYSKAKPPAPPVVAVSTPLALHRSDRNKHPSPCILSTHSSCITPTSGPGLCVAAYKPVPVQHLCIPKKH